MDGAVKVTFYGGSDTESPNYITAIMTCPILFYLFIYLFIYFTRCFNLVVRSN